MESELQLKGKPTLILSECNARNFSLKALFLQNLKL